MGKVVADVMVIATPIANSNLSRIHPSTYRRINSASQWAAATVVAQDAMRFRCPTTDSFVLLTDEKTLARLNRRVVRLHCTACGELHLLRIEGADGAA